MVRLVVEPLLDRGDEDPLLIVVFLDEGPRLSREDALARFQTAPDNDADIHLERELRDTRDRLQSLIEEYETALEELKSSNEELLSVNEELQSSNEEMEASKEELQSLNEELNTVNSELNIKIDALDQAHSDLQGLFESTQIPTVFLDNKLIIRTFTPAVRDLFNILPGDCGRPITDLTSRLPLPGFVDDLEEVLRSSRTLERQLSREGGGKYLLRSAPCRNADAQIEGVVFSFLDVTGLASQQDSGSLLIDDVYRRLHEAFGSASSGAAAQADPLSPEALAVVLVQRVRAIEAALGVLSASGWGQGDVASLLRAQLAPFGLSRADLEGPGVSLPAVALLALGSSFAELLAHGMTRGALLHPDARLAVRWTQAASGVRRDLKIAWRERGVDGARGAALSGPQRDALQREIFGRLGGSVTLRLGRRGYNAALTVPL
jgi:two-component system CheB/CheR fusion protein